jgi:hypothetical protein
MSFKTDKFYVMRYTNFKGSERWQPAVDDFALTADFGWVDIYTSNETQSRLKPKLYRSRFLAARASARRINRDERVFHIDHPADFG